MEISLPIAISLASLVVALVGGVPGVVTVLKERRARGRLAAYARHATVFTVDQPNLLRGLLLDVVVGNLGSEPMLPLVFRLEIKIDGKWIDLPRVSILNGFRITWSDGSLRQFLDSQTEDLNQALLPIANSSSARGCLAYVVPEHLASVSVSQLLVCEKRLVCIDLARRERSVVLNPTTPDAIPVLATQ